MRLGRHFGHDGERKRSAGQVAGAEGRWLRRQIRGLRPDRNPLRRRSDRVEAYLLAGLFVAAAVAAPVAAQAASQSARASAVRLQQEQAATRHQVRAELTQRAGTAADGYSLGAQVLAKATWKSGTGAPESGEVPAPAGSTAGTKVTIWTDASGNLTGPPLAASQVAGEANAAAIGTVAGVAVIFLAGAGATHHVAHRRRLAAWDADWRMASQTWNHQSW